MHLEYQSLVRSCLHKDASNHLQPMVTYICLQLWSCSTINYWRPNEGSHVFYNGGWGFWMSNKSNCETLINITLKNLMPLLMSLLLTESYVILKRSWYRCAWMYCHLLLYWGDVREWMSTIVELLTRGVTVRYNQFSTPSCQFIPTHILRVHILS